MSGPLGGSLKDAAEFAALSDAVEIIVCGVNRELFVDLRSLLESTKNVYLDIGNLCRATFIPQLVNAGFTKRLVCGSDNVVGHGGLPCRVAVLESRCGHAVQPRPLSQKENRNAG